MKKIMFNDKYNLTKSVISGLKTQTRRVIKAPIEFDSVKIEEDKDGNLKVIFNNKQSDESVVRANKYKVGEEVAIAQSYSKICDYMLMRLESRNRKADNKAFDEFVNKYTYCSGWNNKMFVRADEMIYRIKITEVSVQHLQDISEEDCIKEGIQLDDERYFIPGTDLHFDKSIDAFKTLINKVSGAEAWNENPLVFVYEFEVVEPSEENK